MKCIHIKNLHNMFPYEQIVFAYVLLYLCTHREGQTRKPSDSPTGCRTVWRSALP